MSASIIVLPDAAAVAEAALQPVAAAAAKAVASRGRFAIALAGGSTPRRLYGLLARNPALVDWSRTDIFFGDERSVAPDHPDSNYRMAREVLLDRVPVPPGRVHRIRGEDDPAEAADLYERELTRLFPGEDPPHLDLILLGMGEDGHTASLFAGSAAAAERERWVVPSSAPRPPVNRVTLTLPVLTAARRVLFLIVGEDKAAAFRVSFHGGAPGPTPAGLVATGTAATVILVDKEAAGRP